MSFQAADISSNAAHVVSITSLQRKHVAVYTPPTARAFSVKRDLIFIACSCVLFMAMLMGLHSHSLYSAKGLQRRVAPVSTHSLNTEAAIDSSFTEIEIDTDAMSLADLSTDSSSSSRHILSVSSNPSSVKKVRRTPAQRAKAKNPWSPFRSEDDKKARYRQWEGEFQVLLDKHRDARLAMAEWVGKAVNNLPIGAVPMHTTDRCVVVLDGRMDVLFIFLLKHLFHMLGPGWGLLVLHTSANQDWWVDQLQIRPGGPGEHVDMQRVDPITYHQANSVPTSPSVLERIPCENFIIAQPDTMSVRSDYLPGVITGGIPFEEMIDQFVYLGAPWGWCDSPWCRIGGNGGLSFRKKSVMMDLARELRCSDWECHYISMYEFFSHQQEIKMKHVEDTFFAWQMHDHSYKFTNGPTTQLADPNQHAWFALEAMDWDGVEPYFVHKIWNYMSHLRYGPLMAHTMQYYPEIWMSESELAEYKKDLQ